MRKKSENLSNIIKPLHFGHSIDPSRVSALTAGGVPKQELHQFVALQYFNDLQATYLPQGVKVASSASTKTSVLSFFCATKRAR
jgi:hypothetical protein